MMRQGLRTNVRIQPPMASLRGSEWRWIGRTRGSGRKRATGRLARRRSAGAYGMSNASLLFRPHWRNMGQSCSELGHRGNGGEAGMGPSRLVLTPRMALRVDRLATRDGCQREARLNFSSFPNRNNQLQGVRSQFPDSRPTPPASYCPGTANLPHPSCLNKILLIPNRGCG
jgi:hypothetical protein